MTNPTTWTHKGHEITFDVARASFGATIDGKIARSSSLDAIKKRIDTAQANAFQLFDCYFELTGYRAKEKKAFNESLIVASAAEQDHPRILVKAQVIGITVPRKNTRDRAEYRVKIEGSTETTERVVYPAAQEVIDAWTKYWAEYHATKERHAAEDKAVDALKEAIPVLRAGEG